MKKIRGKTPSLITGSSGKPAKTTVKRRRNCSRCSSVISLGETCFEIPKLGGGFTSKKPFCIKCFKEILTQTKKDIASLEEDCQQHE
jgi:ribosomal protein S27AE